MVIWLPEAVAWSTTGPYVVQSTLLMPVASCEHMAAGSNAVSVAAAEPSELETLIGPWTPVLSAMVMSFVLPSPPTVAEQLESLALIWSAMFCAICADESPSWSQEYTMPAIVTLCVASLSVAGPEPSELDTAMGPTTPLRSDTITPLPEVPPTVAVQLGSLAAICAAMLAAICAEVRLPCAQEYWTVPIFTQWV